MKVKYSIFFLALLLAKTGFSQEFIQEQKIIPSDRARSDQFGMSVDIDNRYAIIGAPSKCDTIAGKYECYIGAAYIYEKDSTGWQEAQKLVASDFEWGSLFGSSVAIKGTTAIVAALEEDVGYREYFDYGAVYIFERDTSGNWGQTQKLTAPIRKRSAEFGNAVAFNGRELLIGCYQNTGYSGSAFVFRKNGLGTWVEVQEILPDSSYAFQRFAQSISLSDSNIAIGVPGENDSINSQLISSSGMVYVFEMDNAGVYRQSQKLRPAVTNTTNSGNRFGAAVSIQQDYLLVGEPGRQGGGAASLFKLDTSNSWVFLRQFNHTQPFSAYIGRSVNIQKNNFFIGAPGDNGTGSVYWYQKDTTQNLFHLQQTIYARDKQNGDYFGHALASNSQDLMVGAHLEEHNLLGTTPLPFAGSAYLFNYKCSSSTDTIITCASSYTWIDGVTYFADNNQAIHLLKDKNGCDSAVHLQLTVNHSSTGVDQIVACDSYTWLDGITYTANNNTAIFTSTDIYGCDSLISLDLRIINIDTGIADSGFYLLSEEMNATYQWLNCTDNYAIIPGEKFRYFIPSKDGNYAVMLSINDCIDTSKCFQTEGIGIEENPLQDFQLFPNPATNSVKITFDPNLLDKLYLYIISVNGQLIDKRVIRPSGDTFEENLDVSNFSKGIYQIRLESDSSSAVKTLLIE